MEQVRPRTVRRADVRYSHVRGESMLRVNRGWLFVAMAMASLVSAASAGAQGPRKSIGVNLQGYESGLRVTSVLPGSPADKAGVKAGIQVTSIGGIMVEQLDPDK